MKKLLFRCRALRDTNPRINLLLYCAGALVTGYFSVFAPNAVYFGITNPETYTHFFERFLLVSICAAAFALLAAGLGFLLRSLAASSLFLTALSCAVGVANVNKYLYRGAHITATDIYLMKDAVVAAGDYKVIIAKSFWLLLAASVALAALLAPLRTPTVKGGKVKRAVFAALAGLVCIALALGAVVATFWDSATLKKAGYAFTPKVIHLECINNTFYPSFFRSLPLLFAKAPEGYGSGTMTAIEGDIAAYAAAANGGKEVDIIVLQLESYFYPDVYDLQYDREEVFGPLLQLAEEGSRGYIVSPQTGGGTADVEFEVLTGFTSNDAQVPVNPFSIYTNENTPNIVGYLAGRGYTAVSVHSHSSALYNRRNAYRALGFAKSVFSNNFEEPEMFGSYISEKSCIDKVIEEYDAIVAAGGKAFIHTVTMQNHVQLPLDYYAEADLVACESSTLSAEDLTLARVFLTSSRDVAQQVQRLAQHLEASGRDAMLVIYGDHQSPIARDDAESEFYSLPMAEAYAEATDDGAMLMTHRTPLYVWSTFPYEGEKDLGVIAPNAVLPTVLEAYGVTRPAYFDYLTDSVSTFRSLTGDYIIYKDGTLTTDISEAAAADKAERLLIQHDFLHGKGYLAGKMY